MAARAHGDDGLYVGVQLTGVGTVVTVVGELDMFTEPALRNALAHVDHDVVVDLSRVGFMDSSGLRLLIVHSQRLAAAGASLFIRHPSSAVFSVLQICGLAGLIET
jgi:anti-anti-sigma factor